MGVLSLYATNIRLPAICEPVPTANQPYMAGAAMLNQMSPFALAVMVKVKLRPFSVYVKVSVGEASLIAAGSVRGDGCEDASAIAKAVTRVNRLCMPLKSQMSEIRT